MRQLDKPTTGLCCDASCRPNRGSIKNDGYFHGRCEHRTMDMATGEVLHESVIYQQGTINLAEFLGIYWSLRVLHARGDTTTAVWSDSQYGINWILAKETRSKMPLNEFTYEIVDAAAEAVEWLKKHNPRNPVMKWRTEWWGDIKADYGRK
jgi:ribonuclease HI